MGFRFRVYLGFPVRRREQNGEKHGRHGVEEAQRLENSHTADEDLG